MKQRDSAIEHLAGQRLNLESKSDEIKNLKGNLSALAFQFNTWRTVFESINATITSALSVKSSVEIFVKEFTKTDAGP